MIQLRILLLLFSLCQSIRGGTSSFADALATNSTADLSTNATDPLGQRDNSTDVDPWIDNATAPDAYFNGRAAVGILRQIDRTLTHAKQHDILRRNLPLTHTSFKRLLSTNGPIFKNRLVPTFLRAQVQESFPSLSLLSYRQGENEEEEEESTKKWGNVPLVLYFLEGDLKFFPEDPLQVHRWFAETIEPGARACNIRLDDSSSDSTQSLATKIRQEVNDADCDLVACRSSECKIEEFCASSDEESTGYPYLHVGSCNERCDVVVDVFQKQAFVATVAHFGENENDNLRNVQFIGLYKEYQGSEVSQGLTGNLLPDHILGFPINRPDHPSLVPNVGSWDDLQTKVNQTLVTMGLTDINVSFQPLPNDTKRLDIILEYEEEISMEPFSVAFDTSGGFGMLLDIKVERNHSIDTKAHTKAKAHFQVLLGDLVREPVRMLLKPECIGPADAEGNPTCYLEVANFLLNYTTENGNGTWIPMHLSLPSDGVDTTYYQSFLSREELVGAVTEALNSSLEGIASVTNHSNLTVVEFDPGVRHVEIKTQKECVTKDCEARKDVPVNEEGVFDIIYDCSDNDTAGRPLNISKAYGIHTDQNASKPKFELMIGEIGLSSKIGLEGDLDLTGNVAGFVETSVNLKAILWGNLSLRIGSDKEMLEFPDWLGAARAVLEQENNITEEFLDVSSTFDGNFSGSVKGAFNGNDYDENASGKFLEPFQLTFGPTPPVAVPIELDLDIPDVGDVTKMSSFDVVRLLLFSVDFLVGPDENDSVESCSAGLLGRTEIVPEENVFAYQLPVLGISPCQSVRFLQSLTDTFQLLGNTYGLLEANGHIPLSKNHTRESTSYPLSHNTTFQALSQMLETLLVDRFGESVDIQLNTTSDDDYSDLTLSISLFIPHEERSRLTINLKELLRGQPEVSEDFLHVLSPEHGVESSSDFHFRLSIGLEYDRKAELIRPYIQGTTGLQASWFATGEASFETASIGPFPGSLDVKFCVGNSELEPLTLAVELDSNTNYYVDVLVDQGPSSTRNGFVHTTIDDLLDEIELSFSGELTADVQMGIDLHMGLASAAVELNMTITDLAEFARNPSEGIIVSYNLMGPSILRPSLLQLLLMDPGSLARQLNDALQSVEDAALGPRGVVTTFAVPYLRDSISAALGGNTKSNVLGKSRRLLVESFSAALARLFVQDEDSPGGGPDNFIELIADSIDTALKDAGELIQPGTAVTFTCFSANVDDQNLVVHSETHCSGRDASSVVWNVPLGQDLEADIPLEFSFDERFPFKISVGQDGNRLSTCWSFDLAFGFDEIDGFFLYTGEENEFKIEALMTGNSQHVDASLSFLSAAMEELEIMVGAGFYIDIDKSGMLRSLQDSQERLGARDRISIGDIGRVVAPQDFFHIEARVGATLHAEQITLELNAGESIPEAVKDWIPGVEMSLASQFRKSFTNAGEVARPQRRYKRRLLGGPPTFGALGQLHELYGKGAHPAIGLLQSLSFIEDEVGSSHRTRSLSASPCDSDFSTPQCPAFSFPLCPVDLSKENGCLRIMDVYLRGEGIAKAITSIAKKFVDPDDDCRDKPGILDKIVCPLLFLDEPIPGLDHEKLLGDTTILDIAEWLFDKMGKKGKKFKSGVQSVRTILQMYKDFKKLNIDSQEKIPICDVINVLDGFDCIRSEDSARLLKQRRNRLKVDLPKGLSFPVFDNAGSSVLRILQGKDIRIVDFTPPELYFGFDYEHPVTLWPKPPIILYFELSFGVTLKAGFVLDSKGIREAVEQRAPEKALNSIALKDTFDGVDEPLVTMEARIGASLELNLFVVSARVGGGFSAEGNIDFYDPYPATSMGLIRPYELGEPSEWLEGELSLYIDFRVSIDSGFINWWSWEKKWKIYSKEWIPSPPQSCISQDKYSGNLFIDFESSKNIQCTSLSGSGGQEEIECKCNQNAPFKTLAGVKSLQSQGTQHVASLELLGVHSSTNIAARVENFTLDYTSFGSTWLAATSLTITEKEVTMGESRLSFVQVENGTIKLPQPEMALLRTVVGGSCNNKWDLDGHTDLEINVHELKFGCEIIARGGKYTEAKIVINFRSEDASDCFDGNEVSFGDDSVSIVRMDSHSTTTSFRIELGDAYKSIEIKMTDCNDRMHLNASHYTTKSFSVDLLDGDDTFVVGSHTSGLDAINGFLVLSGGQGVDKLIVDDSGSLDGKKGKLTPATLLGMLKQDLDYDSFEVLDIKLSSRENSFLVTSTPLGSFTSISCGLSSDRIEILASQGSLEIHGNAGEDEFLIFGLGDDTVCTIYGGQGDDVLVVDGTEEFYREPVYITDTNSSTTEAYRELIAVSNKLDGSSIRWSGGAGNDKAHLQLTSRGNMTLDLFDDLDGINTLTAGCSNFSCSLLFRENFLSSFNTNLSAAPSMDGLPVERINIHRRKDKDTKSGFTPTVSISWMQLRLNSGNNSVWFDGTFCAIDLVGGADADEYRFGQNYNESLLHVIANSTFGNSTTAATHGLENASFASDTISAIPTSQGFLSVGNSHPVSVYAKSGKNFFNVRRNGAPILVHGDDGETGNNLYVVQSSLVSVEASRLRSVKLGEAVSNDFTLNSLVHLVGGRGLDKLVVVGTEGEENYVVSREEVRGGGLSIKHTSITELDVLGKDGNDQITVLSSNSGCRTRLFGGLGENVFSITPRLPLPVVSRNMRGHRAILEHYVSSEDKDFLNMVPQGVAVDVFDNDGALGYLLVQDEGVYLMSEETDDNQWSFVFSICPTRQPQGTIVVNLAADVDDQGTRYLSLNGVTEVLQLQIETLKCETIKVKYNANALPLENTAKTVFVTIYVDSLLTTDLLFGPTEQGLSPVSVNLIPGLLNDNAVSVTVLVKSSEGLSVAEGPSGFNATYDIYLRPCTEEMINNTVLTIEPDCPDQIFLELSGQNLTSMAEWNITGSDWQLEENCMVTVTVAAVEDNIVEGLHFNRLRHTVRDRNGTVILLPFGSFLDANDILVKIYDQDSPSLITQQPFGFLATAELNLDDRQLEPSLPLKEEYFIRLSKQPEANVNITVLSIPVATDYFANSTSLRSGRNFTRRSQASFPNTIDKARDAAAATSSSTAEDLTVVFTPENWFEWQTVRMVANNDKIEEGVDYYTYPSLFEPSRGKGKGKGGRSLYTNRFANYGYCNNNRRLGQETRKRRLRTVRRSELKQEGSHSWKKTRSGAPESEVKATKRLSRGREHAGPDRRNLRQASRDGVGPPARKWKMKTVATKSGQKQKQEPKEAPTRSSNRVKGTGALNGHDTEERKLQGCGRNGTRTSHCIFPEEQDVSSDYFLAGNGSYPTGNWSYPTGNWTGNWTDELEKGKRPKRNHNLDENPLLGGPVEISENGDGESPEDDDETLLAPGALYFG